jgi:hypothetical protein
MAWPGWPPYQRPATIEIAIAAPQPAQQQPRTIGYREMLAPIEAEVRRLNAQIEELTQTVTALQQQPVRRRRWYQRLTVLETWGDDDRA